jgi:hypothetical protein
MLHFKNVDMKLELFNIKNILAGLICLIMINGFYSCKKYIDIDIPPNAVGQDNAFSDSTTATSVVLGLYGGAASGASSVIFNVIKYGAMSADEGYYITNSSFDNFKNNTLAAGNDANSLYSALYTRVGRANYAIEGLTASSSLAPALKNQLLGEAKFWRAWLYFYLVNYFGKVPLVTSTAALETSQYPRTAVEEIYQQIVTDLVEAKDLLTPSYPSMERARINKHAASAFLAKVYLYRSDWAAAEAEATSVISSGTYSLADLDKVFLMNSNETIWQISLAGTFTPATVMGAEFIPPSTAPNFVLYDTLANTFEANDQRKVVWTKSIDYLGKTYYYPYKYKVRQATAGNEYPVVIRLAEIYLIRAEARARQHKVEDGVKDLNVIRQRAQIPPVPLTVTEGDLLLAIEHERWVELFTEAHRWFDLKRWSKAPEVLRLIKPSWKDYQQLYPIPNQERNANPNLDNNPEY